MPSAASIAALADVTMRPPGYVDGEHSAPIPLPAPIDTADFEVTLDSEMPPAMSLGPSAPPSVARFGRYQILGRLAMGGMAEIFLAREETAGGGVRNVVVKLAREQLVDLTGFEEMFTNEGRLSMRLTHPNICHVYEFGKERGRYFMALEWVDGVSMRDLTRRAKSRGETLPVNVVVKVVAQVAEALDSAHRTRDGRGRPLNIVHRDVSPHNVMVSYDGVIKLLDFGVAKGRTTKEETDSGTVKGKFNYMSPQQCTGRAVDGRADVFSLGVCLWEALVAKSLFKRETQYETFKAIIEDDVPLVSGIRDDVPPELDEIIQKAVAKTLADRYKTAADFHEALSRFLQKRGDVVSSATIASYMETLFEEEIAAGPELDTSEEVVARIALPGAREESDDSLASVGPPKPNVAVVLVAVAVLVLVGILAASAWFSDPEGHDSVRRSNTMSTEGPTGGALEEPQEPQVSPPVEPEGAGPEAMVGADEGAEAQGAEDPGDPRPEEAGARSRANGDDRAGMRGSGMRSPRMRRSMGSGFVADPGF